MNAQRRAAVICALAVANLAHGAEVEPVVVLDHTSNVFRGRPLNDREELTADYFGVGVTVTAGRRERYEIDLSHGVARFEGGAFESASKLSVRWYPRRRR